MSKSSFYADSGASPTETDAIESSVASAASSATAAATSATASATSAAAASTNVATNAASAAASEVSRVASVAAKDASVVAKTASETAQATALVSKNAAATSETNAAASETSASSDAATATTKASEAAASATASEASKVTSVASAATATTKASESSTSATNSASSATASEVSRVASVAAKTASETAETNAETAETNSGNSATASASSATASASSATASEASKVTSVNSATTATTKASEASTSASSASTSASTATTKAADSETARAASVVAKDASVVAKDASVVAKNAAVAAQAAAETAETNAETAETNSASSATAGATSATAAATSATASEASKVTSVASASAAATSETNAASSETNAASSYDLFDDRMLGAKSSAPTVDNDGAALVQGTLYFDTSSQTMKVYGSSGWVPAGSSVNGTSARFKFVATNNQTTFSGADANSNTLGYDAGFLDVYLSGIRLVNGTDFTASTGTNIVLAAGAATGDILEVVAYGTFVLANFDADKLDGQHGAYYTAYADTAVASLVDSSPSTLDTLNELAAALGDDPNFATTVSTSIGNKLSLSGGTLTGDLDVTADGADIRVNSADYELVQFGKRGSSGADLDKGYLRMKSQGTNKIILDTAGTSSLLGGGLSVTGSVTADSLTVDTSAGQLDVEALGGSSVKVKSSGSLKLQGTGGSVDLINGSTEVLSTTSSGISVNGTATMDGLVVEPSSATGLTYAADGTNSYINFEANSISDSVQLYAGQSSGGYLSIGTKNSGGTLAERMRLDGGNLLVGKTASNNGVAGVEASVSNGLSSTVSGDTVSRLNRLSSDGEILRFQKDTATVGSIGVVASEIAIGSNDAFLWTSGNNNAFLPASTVTGGASNGLLDLGSTGRRFKDLYIAGLNVTASTYNKISSYFSGSYTSGFKFSDMNGGIWYDAGADDLTVSAGHANSQLILESGGSASMTLNASGHAIIPAGVTLGTAAGTYSAANTLDDYEEGTWTPALTGSSGTSGTAYTTQQGSYTKIGNTVTANFQILLSNEGTLTGTTRISGLPFSGVSSPLYQTATLMCGNTNLDKDQKLTGMQYAVNAFIYLMIEESDVALSQAIGNGPFKNNTEISGSVTYFTNS